MFEKFNGKSFLFCRDKILIYWLLRFLSSFLSFSLSPHDNVHLLSQICSSYPDRGTRSFRVASKLCCSVFYEILRSLKRSTFLLMVLNANRLVSALLCVLHTVSRTWFQIRFSFNRSYKIL